MWTEEKLNEMLVTPSEALVEDMKKNQWRHNDFGCRR